MHSNYKRLGDYIRLVDERNRNLEVTTLLGVSVSKEFMPSIANTVGTDFTKYKIVKRNQFTYIADTSRRGDKIGLALLEKYDEALVSQAYTVFEITNEGELLPQYLMMWFRRPEFDRYARFKSHGSVREIFDWEEMCNVELPVPPIEKQREMVAEYQAVERRIRLNNALCQKLEDAAQTIYRQWFEDFEFPVRRHCEERGTSDEAIPQVAEPESSYGEIAALPLAMTGYKSSGGKMVYSEELGKDIPEGWNVGKLGDFNLKYGKNLPTENLKSSGYKVFGGNGLIGYYHEYLHDNKQVIISCRGAASGTVHTTPAKSFITNNSIIIENLNTEIFPYLSGYCKNFNFINYVTGSAQPQITIESIKNISFLFPNADVVRKYGILNEEIFEKIDILNKQTQKLEELKSLLLGKMAVGEKN